MTSGASMTRREFAAIAGGAVLSVAFGPSCRALGGVVSDGRLTARPQPAGKTTASGEKAMGLATSHDAILRVPANAPAGPMPFLLFLHGATQSGERMMRRLGTAPDDHGVVVAAPDARGVTWDAIRGDFGPDVAFLDRVLAQVFSQVAVDPARVAVGGFSDGATYAISLGLINGDLFQRVVACSPGFVIPGPTHGQPKFFISHGRSDDILPIDSASRLIVPALRAHHYDVTYREFDGTHEMPPAVVEEAMTWVGKG